MRCSTPSPRLGRGRCLPLLALLPLLAACGDPAPPSGPIQVEGPGFRGVMLPADAWAATGYEAEGYWAPTVEDVRRAEAALPAAARRLLPDLEVPLDRYVRQYVGVVAEGRRLLYLNLVHRDALAEEPEMRDAFDRRMVVVDDGGDRYVEGFFDPEQGDFSDLFVHGEA